MMLQRSSFFAVSLAILLVNFEEYNAFVPSSYSHSKTFPLSMSVTTASTTASDSETGTEAEPITTMATSTTPKKIINEPSNAVSEFISGLLLQYPNKLQKLANHDVILSTSIDYDKVNILSGGGSGHEPSHAGWVGSNGMLTGAILGGIFASPSVASILAAIRAVTKVNEGKGCLLIVKNYTGDRLNFGMACEIANNEGRKCKMVVVADDTALEREKGITGSRGVAGTLLVHKVAGAAAQKGLDLDDVVSAADDMAGRVKTLGVALNSVTIPGATTVNDRLDNETIEIGLGIHGEAGTKQSSLKTADELASIIVDTVQKFGREESDGSIVPTFKAGDELAVMVNNLGGVSNFEMSILTNSVVQLLESEQMGQCLVSRIYVGAFMTSFDMQGASVSVVSLSDAPDTMVEYLDDETDAAAWVKADISAGGPRLSASEVPEVEAPKAGATNLAPVTVTMDDFKGKVEKCVKAACTSLIDSEPMLTKYDTIVGDGDCGITMMRGAQEILARVDSKKIDTSHPVPFFETLADAVSASMGGTSGILLEIMFRKMSTFLNSEESAIDTKGMEEAFEEGVNAVSFYGGATSGSRTMLDALFPAVEALKKGEDCAKAAVAGAQATAEMGTASAGRSNYLNEDTLSGTPDPGAVAVGLVLTAIHDGLC